MHPSIHMRHSRHKQQTRFQSTDSELSLRSNCISDPRPPKVVGRKKALMWGSLLKKPTLLPSTKAWELLELQAGSDGHVQSHMRCQRSSTAGSVMNLASHCTGVHGARANHWGLHYYKEHVSLTVGSAEASSTEKMAPSHPI